MNFNNTTEFFEMVADETLTNIDIKRYVQTITDNHNLEFLKSLQFDIGVFISMYREDLEEEITDKDWEEKIEYYKEKGEEMPLLKHTNWERKIKERKGEPYEHLPEFTYSYDKEKIFYPYAMFRIRQLEFYIKNLIKDNENPQPTKPNKPNKSLLFEGKDLNLSERYKIANKVLKIDKEIRKLNAKDLEKHRLLAYILGCDITNARNLMNGTYKSKDRDLTNYFNELGLKE
jgi:hypothetical protein